jgi:predicted GH43/DUF377 family glycosyl hydrolase
MSEEDLKKFITKNKAKGTMPKVTFCCGAVLIGNKLRIYYGAGDTYICTATASLDDIFKLLPKNKRL